jgi:hypothetical protein
LSAFAAQHALPFAHALSFATALFVEVEAEAEASADAPAFIFAQQAAVLFAQAAFSAAVQDAFVSAGTVDCAALAVCADANVANPANAKSNANFFIVWNDDFVEKNGMMNDEFCNELINNTLQDLSFIIP